jgi:hypothetical protein
MASPSYEYGIRTSPIKIDRSAQTAEPPSSEAVLSIKYSAVIRAAIENQVPSNAKTITRSSSSGTQRRFQWLERVQSCGMQPKKQKKKKKKKSESCRSRIPGRFQTAAASASSLRLPSYSPLALPTGICRGSGRMVARSLTFRRDYACAPLGWYTMRSRNSTEIDGAHVYVPMPKEIKKNHAHPTTETHPEFLPRGELDKS